MRRPVPTACLALLACLAGSDRWGYSANTELRFTDDGLNPGSSVLRGALAYRMDGGVRLGAGSRALP